MFVIDSKPDTKPFCFIGHPKMASQSVRKALLNIGARSLNGHHGYDEGVTKRIRDAGGVVCCVVRNPWDVMVSWWSFKSMKANNTYWPNTPAFAEWLPEELKNEWSMGKSLYYGLPHCNRIIRFEHSIHKQLNGCLLDCGLPQISLPRIGGSPRDNLPYQPFYTTDLAILVYRRFAVEIEEWGYKFEDL